MSQQPTTNNQQPIRVRFAPSPTGNLHIGSARTALYNWLFAKSNNGTFILRIEDTDIARSTKDFETSILEDLEWLGLKWDEGPGVKGPHGPYHQSKRFDIYSQKAAELVEKNLAYECYCSPEELEKERKEALKKSQMPRYSGKCIKLTEEQKSVFKEKNISPSIRFKVPEEEVVVDDLIHGMTAFDSKTIGDFVILRSDGAPTFHLSVVVDDGEMKITHVIRGDDHLPNTPKHILLFKALGYQVPKFAHHSLIKAKDGGKLSKRHGAAAVFEYREQGYLPQAIDNYLALLSWTPPEDNEILTRDELVKYFKIKGLSKSSAIFDIDKLKWLNGQHIRRLSVDELAKKCLPYLEKAAYLKEKIPEARLKMICEAIRDNLVTLNESADYAQVFFEKDIEYGIEVADYVTDEISKTVFKTAIDILKKNNIDSKEKAKEFLSNLAGQLKPKGIKGKHVYMPLRVALTASTTGPELFYLLQIFGIEKVKERLQKALKFPS